MRLARWCILGVVLLPSWGWGQPLFSLAPSLETPFSLGGGYYALHFQPDEGSTSELSYTAAAYGIYYARSDLEASLVYGPSTRRSGYHRLLDAAFLVHYPLVLWHTDRVQWSIPLGLEVRYRAVNKQAEQAEPAFQAMSFLIAAGPALRARVGNLQVEGKATYALGISSRPFSNQTGRASRAGVHVRLHLRDLFSSYGLTLGYGYSIQEWNIASSVFSRERATRWHYRDAMQIVTLGVNWR